MADVRAIAFYLPQFHPIPENDVWWGNGFTEWTNVTRARPLFRGHQQPRVPGGLGFYDLRLPEVRAAQAELAARFGLHGFCYYYYWFNGRRLLERPLEEVFRTGKPDLPFCLCWANENWTRRWDGAEHELLVGQVHSEESDAAFIRDVLPLLKDPRYIRVGGAPLLAVYRVGLLPNPKRTTEIWREAADAAGLSGLHLCAVQSFGLTDPRPFGFDAAIEFPPHNVLTDDISSELKGLVPGFKGKVVDYRAWVDHALSQPRPPYRQYRGVMPSWDNTARRGKTASVFHHATPRRYELYLRAIVAETEATLPPDERLVFINAWNEWAEGTYLEPDQRHGYALLEATARALRHRADWKGIIEALRATRELSPELLRQYSDDLEFALEARERSLRYLRRTSAVVDRLKDESKLATFSPRMPSLLKLKSVAKTGVLHLDRVRGASPESGMPLRRTERILVEGWAFAPELQIDHPGTAAFLVLSSIKDGSSYFAPLLFRKHRPDVVAHHPAIEAKFTSNAGFHAMIWCEAVPPGEYRMGAVHVNARRAAGGVWGPTFQVE